MSKRIFTSEQTAQIEKNERVVRCSARSITWTQQFKLQAVILYEKGLTPREIFKQAGLDLSIIGQDQPKECLKRWNRIFRRKGVVGFNRKRGGPGRPKKITNENESVAEKIKRLETEVAYLKAENNFLSKLRKKSLN